MAYRIEFTSTARREFAKLAPEMRRRLAPVIDRLADDPRPSGAASLKGTTQGYRVRIGAYRVLYQVNDNERLVIVFRIGDRREVCRRRP
jgi:mRNA interferase RelE/StbE